MPQPLTVHWFRQDLRLADNPALRAAAAHGRVLPVYILDDASPQDAAMGGAMRWWTHHSLAALEKSLGCRIALYRGNAEDILIDLVQRHGISNVHWNRCYEPWRIRRDTRIKERLDQLGVEVESHNGSLLWEPWQVQKSDGKPYKVFTPFYHKGCLGAAPPRVPLEPPAGMTLMEDARALSLDELELLPRIRWDKALEPHWDISEAGAHRQLSVFQKQGIESYRENRNFPAKMNVSRLSPYLHSGQLSPNQVWHAARGGGHGPDIDHFCSELGWREFSYSLLYHFPELPHRNWQPKFNTFPWRSDEDDFGRWAKGNTGYPLVDAGMRELWQTGYMHNRLRMVAASFLVKNLLIDWRRGAEWFWDCLVDADLANNSASWQWVAGSGADAAPYFRIFNPVGQGEKFDPGGAYTRRYVPEIAKLPDAYLFRPWQAPAEVLRAAGVSLGETYPLPMVDLASSRNRALAALQATRGEDAIEPSVAHPH